jgi:hypothetical protein
METEIHEKGALPDTQLAKTTLFASRQERRHASTPRKSPPGDFRQ